MGGEQSVIEKPSDFDYMAITFKTSDRIRLMYADDKEIDTVREAITQSWDGGIQSESTLFGSVHQFKLYGFPFNAPSFGEASFIARRLACQILSSLFEIGCKLVISSDLSQTSYLTTWFFHREPSQVPKVEIACIGFSANKLKFVNFPTAIAQSFENVVLQAWPKLIAKTENVGEFLSIQLNGRPWDGPRAQENVQANILIKALVNYLYSQQWGLYGNGTLKGSADTLFFRHDPSLPIDGSLATGFIMSLNQGNRIRCVEAPHDVPRHVGLAINNNWPNAARINESANLSNAVELLLDGEPWQTATFTLTCTFADTCHSRMYICKILEKMMSVGWKVQLGIDLSRDESDKTVMLFNRCTPINAPVFCISLIEKNKIHIISAPQNVIDALRAEIQRTWLLGIAKEKTYENEEYYKIRLNGKPWTYNNEGHDGAHARIMLCYLLKVCAQLGWYVTLSADISAKYKTNDSFDVYPNDVHSLWFVYLGNVQQTTA